MHYMKTWEDSFAALESLSQEEKLEIRQLAHITAKIIKQRHKLGLTQQEVADRAGLKQEAVARLEAGKRMPRFDTLLRISNSLNMDITVKTQAVG
jgi:predicted transcriptional regulator